MQFLWGLKEGSIRIFFPLVVWVVLKFVRVYNEFQLDFG
jgi:hypothetical protein